MKIFKILAYIIGIVIVLIAAALFAFTQYFDPNKYKDEIVNLAKPYIGDRQLSIEGDMQVSVFPWIGVDIGSVKLSQPSGFEQGDMIRFDGANVQLKLSALFQGNFEVDKVELIKPYVHLITKQDGQNNYADLLQAPIDKNATKTHDDSVEGSNNTTPAEMGDAEVITSKDNQSPAQQAQEPQGFDLSRLSISGVTLVDGTFIVDNLQTEQNQKLEKVNLELGELRLGQPLSTQLSAAVSATQLPKDIRFDFSGNIETNESFTDISLFSGEVDMNYGELPVTVNIPALSYKSDIDSLTLPSITIKQNDLVLDSAISAFNLKTAMNLNGQVTVASENLVAALSRFGVDTSAITHSLENLVTTAKFDFENNQLKLEQFKTDANVNTKATTIEMPSLWLDLDKQLVKIAQLSLKQEGLDVALAEVNGANILSELAAMQLSSKMTITANQLGQLLADNGFADILKPQAIATTRVNATVNLANNNLEITQLESALDDMTVTGNVSLKNLTNPAYGVKLNVNEINIDNILAMFPESTSKAANSSATSVSANANVTANVDAKVTEGQSANANEANSQAVSLPVAPFKTLGLDADIKVNRIISGDLVLSQVELVTNAKQGVVKINPLKAKVADGSIESIMTYDVSGQLPSVVVNNTVTRIDVGKLLRALEVNDQLEGTANLSTKLKAQGANADSLIANLNGSVSTQFLDGSVRGIDLQSMLLKAKNTISSLKGGEQEQNYQPEAHTKFAELAASFAVTDGVFRSDDISMKAPALRLDGGGEINVPESKINLRLGINVVKTVEGQGGAGLDELEGVRIPFKVKGALTSPSYGIDFTTLLRDRAKQELKKELLKELPGENEKVEQILDDPNAALKQAAKEKLAEELGSSEDPEKAEQAEQILDDPGKAIEDAAKKELQKGLEKLFNF